ncbi:unnamed protein product [Blepharisma stoltei]|uniref:Pre-mRNA-processing factor 39 n=1 Tax=Blepharisma stoltei TaxID=1481888 RepID=A0AAU9K543_9CILI|nr:unnamed protein product [Blepharisma stoltei]
MTGFLAADFAMNFQTQEREDENKLRQILLYNPYDFDIWLELIKQVEKYKSNEKSKSIYQEFLQEFPQYYPIWRKLADVYSSENNYEMVTCTYEEGLKYIPVSVDLWLHYCIWKTDHCTEEETRELFIKATNACGKVYTSNLLWDKYLDFEKNHKNYAAMETIFSNLLIFPTNKLYEYYTRFKNFIDAFGKNLPSLASQEDYEFAKKKRVEDIVIAYEKVVVENNKRKTFEQGIKRSNFSTKDLDNEQIHNWRRYLEFEENEGDDDRIRLLYERCIVAACYYSEFWIRYARYIEKVQGFEKARELYSRANTHFLSRRPDLFIAQGYFEELHKHIDEARKLYKHAYEDVTPGLLEGVYKHINLERRQRNFEEVDRLFKFAYSIALENGKSDSIVFVAGQYANFSQHQMNNLDKAIEIYSDAIKKAGDKKSIYYAYINALGCLTDLQDKKTKIRDVYELGLSFNSDLSPQEKLELWVSYIDFMRDSWENGNELKELEERFRLVFHHQAALTQKFKASAKIKRMRRVPIYEESEPNKRQHIG